MKYLKLALVFASAMFGGSISVFAGAGTYEPPRVTRLQPNVTYSDTATGLITYAGFIVSAIKNNGTNTINDITITISAKTDRGDPFSLYRPDFYLSQLKDLGCAFSDPALKASPVTITCKIKQLKPGFGLTGFTVFYTAPSTAGGVSPDNINLEYRVDYAEGSNDCVNGCANSFEKYEFPENKVLLGTTNPIDVKSGVPRNGARLFTGNGVPKNEPNKRFTEEVQIPSLATLPTPIPYATSELLITYVESTDTTKGVDCLQLGNFQDCPTYETRIVGPTLVPVEFSVANPLKIIYRIDSANVKRAPNQLFNNLEIRYTPDDSSLPVVDVPKTCTNDQASGDGIPCVLSFQCYKPNEKTPDLKGDCELVTLGLKNGRLAIR